MLKRNMLMHVIVFLVHVIGAVTGLLEFSKSIQDLYTIRTVQGVTIATCKHECESRQRCISAIYYRNADYCILTSNDTIANSSVVSKGAVLLSGLHSPLDQNGSYLNCGGQTCLPKETCTRKSQGNDLIQVCEITECQNPRSLLPKGVKVNGNIYTVGSKIRVGCDQKTIQCGPDGNWTNIGLINSTALDCSDVEGSSGEYTIYPDHQVYCNMDTEPRQWLVFQRRYDGTVDFFRSWTEYRNGFGSLSGEFWLGLQTMYEILCNGEYELRVDMEDFDGVKRYAQYSTFSINSETDNYRPTATGYTGDAGNCLGGHSGMEFSTKDRDNDVWGSSCALSYYGAWWYRACHSSNLNGLYYPDGTNTTLYARHVHWSQFRGYWNSLKKTEMKFRRKWFA